MICLVFGDLDFICKVKILLVEYILNRWIDFTNLHRYIIVKSLRVDFVVDFGDLDLIFNAIVLSNSISFEP